MDSERLILQLAKVLAGMPEKAPFPVLLQVNAGNDPAKFGCEPELATPLARLIAAEPLLKLEGLMTIAPMEAPGELARPCFANLRQIREQLQQELGMALPELSMGMTGDLEAAIAEGSTLIRVGTALFGSREQT
ncbi:MAG: alanine racemase [Verrucomicrobia bacterium]|nr:alanine racemase [Verrucomicrobiota bacterium]